MAVKDIYLDVDNRHLNIQIGLSGRGRENLAFKLNGGAGRKQPFDGPYQVTSEVDGLQILQTENKVMPEDLVVMPIPYSETSNPKGGLTVCIGGY